MQLICQCVLRKVVILFRRDRVKIIGGSTIIRLLVELDGRLCICSKGGCGLFCQCVIRILVVLIR